MRILAGRIGPRSHTFANAALDESLDASWELLLYWDSDIHWEAVIVHRRQDAVQGCTQVLGHRPQAYHAVGRNLLGTNDGPSLEQLAAGVQVLVPSEGHWEMVGIGKVAAQQAPCRMGLPAARKRVALAEALVTGKPYCYVAFWAIDKQTRKIQAGAYDGRRIDAIH